jgi:dTDP-4-amino-4,6-dideoxygalactose transaminase
MEVNSGSSSFSWKETEAEIAELTGTRDAVLCSSARTAIRLSLLVLNIGYGSEVVIPDFACQILPITAFCVGATPKFFDIGKQNLTPSVDQIEAAITPKTKAIIFVHLFGLPVDPSPILHIARQKGIAFIDDAAQALGASINGRKAGSFGDLGILTFNKFLEVDLGGAVTTNNRELADKIRSLRAKLESKSIIVSLGYGLTSRLGLKLKPARRAIFFASNQLRKMTSITFAKKHFRETNDWVVPFPEVMKLWRQETLRPEVVDQLMTYAGRYWHNREMDKCEILGLKHEFRKIDSYLEDRRRIAALYKDLLESEHFSAVDTGGTSRPSYLRFPVLADDSRRLSRCMRELSRVGIKIEYRYKPLHSSPFFSWTSPNTSYEGSTHVYQHILPLPIRQNMDANEVQKVVSIVKSASSG